MTQNLLQVVDLRAYYKAPTGLVKAVDGVDLVVGEKEIIGIAGESGCGKTTLAKAVLRLLKAPGYIDSGSVLFNGVDLLNLDDEEFRKMRWSLISYIPQSSMNVLNPVLRIEDQIIDTLRAHEDWPGEKSKQKALELLKLVVLPERCVKMYPHELSGGMKQRVVLGLSMALNPRLIIADEPTTALDVVIQKGVLQLLAGLRERLGVSILFITHDIAVLAEIADRIAIMYAGKIVEIEDMYSIFKDPLHPYSRALIDSVPSLEKKKELKGLAGRPPSLLDPPFGCRFNPRCPHAMEKCSNIEPLLHEMSPGRWVACHLYGQ